MDFLSNLAKGAQPKSSGDEKGGSDLLGSAKIVAEAAQAQFSGQSDKYDKAKVAGAAADILDAASDYGKLDESQGVGKYVEQAETYLRQYDTTPKPSADEPTKPAEEPKKATEAAADEITKQVDESTIDDSKTEETKPEAAKTDDVEPTTEAAPEPAKAETGPTDYVKVAEGFLGKASGDGEKKEGESGGFGDALKTAGSFFK